MEIVTKIAAVPLTNNQILNWAPHGVWKRFSYVAGEVVGISDAQPSSADVDALKAALAALPDTVPLAVIISRFNSKIFFGRLIQEFSAERWFALSKLGIGWTMQQLVDYPNFAGLKAYANGLLMDGTIQEADALIINACLLEQGIDLNNF